MYMEDITVEYLETLKISNYFKKNLCNLHKKMLNENDLLEYAQNIIMAQLSRQKFDVFIMN